MSYQQLTTE